MSAPNDVGEIGDDGLTTDDQIFSPRTVEENVRNQPRIPARLGPLSFKYTDPAVNVTTEKRVVEHKTIDNQVITQTLGRKPDQISIEGVVADYELQTIDEFVSAGVLELRTDRWSGDVLVKSTNSTFKRAKSSDLSWLYDVTIECIEIDELPPQEELIQTFGAERRKLEGATVYEFRDVDDDNQNEAVPVGTTEGVDPDNVEN